MEGDTYHILYLQGTALVWGMTKDKVKYDVIWSNQIATMQLVFDC